MPGRVLVFEDSGAANFRPLAWTRPVWDLRCGLATLAEKIAAAYAGAEIMYHVRPHLAEVVDEQWGSRPVCRPADANRLAGPTLLVNGRTIADVHLARRVPVEGPDELFLAGDDVLAVRLADGSAASRAMQGETFDAAVFRGLPERQVEVPVARWPWDLIDANGREIATDFAWLAGGGAILGRVHPTAIIDGRQNVHIAPGAEIQAGAMLLADAGPIYIGPGATVMAGAAIEGPAVVGAESRIKMLARIYGGTTIGPVCKVGGEVEHSIILAFSNKQHEGFLGHSYLGTWCNLGAGTETSDLKNNYSTVRVSVEGRQVDTGRLFLGVVMGDHSKSGIGTTFNTGTVVGVGCNLFGPGLPPKDVPSFVWGGAAGLEEHQFDKFVQTAERVMARRDKRLTPALRALLEHVYHQTREHRRAVASGGSGRGA